MLRPRLCGLPVCLPVCAVPCWPAVCLSAGLSSPACCPVASPVCACAGAPSRPLLQGSCPHSPPRVCLYFYFSAWGNTNTDTCVSHSWACVCSSSGASAELQRGCIPKGRMRYRQATSAPPLSLSRPPSVCLYFSTSRYRNTDKRETREWSGETLVFLTYLHI